MTTAASTTPPSSSSASQPQAQSRAHHHHHHHHKQPDGEDVEHRPHGNNIFTQPWGTTWRKALVSLPRALPDATLHLTSPHGPHPLVIKISSRDKKRHIPLYVFIPPRLLRTPSSSRSSSPTPSPTPSPSSSYTNLAKKGKFKGVAVPPTILKFPVLVDFHGGSFVFGSCHEQAPFCAKMCRDLDCIAISVDYSLGPASRFPAANHDAEDVVDAILNPQKPGYMELRKGINAATKHRLSHLNTILEIDTSKIAFSGFSSGGNLALNLALHVPITSPHTDSPWPSPIPSNHPTQIPFALYYPSFDARQLPHERPRPPCMGEQAPKGFVAGLRLEADLMPTYLPRNKAAHPRASPGLVDIQDGKALHDQARMLLILPGMDTLAEQSNIWVDKVKASVRKDDLQVERIPDAVHGWTQFPDALLHDDAKRSKNEVFEKTVQFIRDTWGLNMDNSGGGGGLRPGSAGSVESSRQATTGTATATADSTK